MTQNILNWDLPLVIPAASWVANNNVPANLTSLYPGNELAVVTALASDIANFPLYKGH